MKFVIRDDDICYHTKAEDIERIYGEISKVCPVSFSCIPYVGGYDVDNYQADDWEKFDEWWKDHQTKEIYDIASNPKLISLLRGWVQEGRASIMLHGIHHTLYELATKKDLGNKIAQAKMHLEEVFQCDVNVATPPNNTLSKSSTRAICGEKMNVLVAYGHRPLERPMSIANVWGFIKLLIFFLKHKHKLRYPYPLEFPLHKEQACYHLGPNDSFDRLLEGLEYALLKGGNFVIATHFYHLIDNDDLISILERLVNKTKELTDGNDTFVTAEKLFF